MIEQETRILDGVSDNITGLAINVPENLFRWFRKSQRANPQAYQTEVSVTLEGITRTFTFAEFFSALGFAWEEPK